MGVLWHARRLPEFRRSVALMRRQQRADYGDGQAESGCDQADRPVDLLLVQPPTQADAQIARRVDARLRQGRTSGIRHSAAMAVLGAWPTARLTLRTARIVWVGLDGVGPTASIGRLAGGRATVVAETRGAGRPHTARLWPPTATGATADLTELPAPESSSTPSAAKDTTAPDAPRRLVTVA
jgi:hypothetical protein